MSSLHEVLTKHGYEHQGRSTYKKGKFTVTAGENGKSWRHSHNPMGLDIGTNGWGHDTLDNHLGLLNRRFGSGDAAAIRSQHAEEEQPTGHVTAELAEKILAERRTFNGNLV